jgi:crotonobetainyl-CoA:carnitine CoA-transferase CaiB-like acyl-CoA transferase
MGGMFAVIGILAALQERQRTGRGQLVRSALFENNAFLVSPHMAQFAVTGKPPTPMPARTSAWGIYDVFDTADGQQIFIAVVTDTQWRAFCEAFGQRALLADATLATNPLRVAARERLLASLRELFKTLTRAEISRVCEAANIGFAPIRRPDELLDDPHLACPGAMVSVALPQGGSTPIPALPIEMDGQRLKKRLDIPRVGEHSTDIANELGCEPKLIEELVAEGVLGVHAADAEQPAADANDRISEIASA